MNPWLATILAVVSALQTGCDDSRSLSYATRAAAAAEAEGTFARGWLPEIIPATSKEITMTNDLDLNVSDGSFQFDASDHDAFVAHLTRSPGDDRDGAAAYSFERWTFWISPDRSSCKFHARLTSGKTPGNQDARSNSSWMRESGAE